jgi:hypothetical protein
VTVSSELSTASVWQSTVTLAAPKTFTATGYDETVWTSPKTVEACAMRSSHAGETKEVRPGVS